MAQPKICYNISNFELDIFDFHSGTKIGTLLKGELFTDMGYSVTSRYDGKSYRVYRCMTPTRGWTECRIPADSSYFRYPAYTYDSKMWGKDGNPVFNCRRAAKVYAGKVSPTHINTIYSGDYVLSDGNSHGGATYPNRLYILGYNKDGTWRYSTDLWVETGINIAAYNGSPSIYGNW